MSIVPSGSRADSIWMALAAATILTLWVVSASAAEIRPLIVVTGGDVGQVDIALASRVIETRDDPAPGRSLADLLDQLGEVNLKRFGSLNGYSLAYLRGAAPNQVAVYIDSIPISGAADGLIDLAAIPAGMVERIEIYKGAAPFGLAEPGMAGAINIVTKSSRDRVARAIAAARIGSYRHRAVGLSATRPITPNFAIEARADLSENEGDFEFLDNNGTPHNTSDDSIRKRVNNDSARRSFGLNGSLESGRWAYNLSGGLYQRENGLPGIGINQSETERFELKRALIALNAKRALGPSSSALGYQLDYRLTSARLFHARQISATTPNPETKRRSDRIALSGGIESYDIHPGSLVALFAALSRERSRKEKNGAFEPLHTRDGLGANALIEREIFGGRLALNATARYQLYQNRARGRIEGDIFTDSENFDARHDLITYKLGALYRPAIDSRVAANLGVNERAPSFLELFGEQGLITGSPDLRSERSIYADLTARLGKKREARIIKSVTLEGTLFSSVSEDLITFSQTSPRTVKAINVDKALAYGLDLTGSIELARGYRISLGYELTEAINKSPAPSLHNKRLPDRPARRLKARFETFPIKEILTFGYQIERESDIWLDELNQRKINTQTISSIDARLARGSCALSFEVRNLADADVVDAIGYPAPGRVFYAGLSWSI